MPSYRLEYFEKSRSRGELPRLIFAAAGEKYEEVGIPVKSWVSTEKASTLFSLTILSNEKRLIHNFNLH